VFRIKICGITSEKDALAAADAGADAIGLNFYERSPRYVEPDVARQITNAAGPGLMKVGLFVNAELARIQQAVDRLQLDAVQLHGDESPEFVASVPHPNILRARRLDELGISALATDLTNCQSAGRLPTAVLADAAAPGQFGGTGQTLDWRELVDWQTHLLSTPLILAGGLTPENVAEAIRTVRPYGVDVASGVESSPGVKDPEKIQRFVAAAKTAFAAISK
jgi:phosphoribosylanthranilate isomerase